MKAILFVHVLSEGLEEADCELCEKLHGKKLGYETQLRDAIRNDVGIESTHHA